MPSTALTTLLRLLAALVVLIGWAPAAAQTPSPPQPGKSARVDITETPVMASSRVVGMSGAYTAIAEESVSIPFNPAAVAHRPYYSLDWWDWTYNWDIFAPGLFQDESFDFDNSGFSASDGFVAFAIGGSLQFYSFGLGLHFRGQRNTLRAREDAKVQLRFSTYVGELALGYALLDHRLVLGVGITLGRLSIKDADELFSEALAGSFGMGFDVGMLIRPRDLPLRVGVSFASPQFDLDDSYVCDTIDCPPDLFLPGGITSGWRLSLGAAWQFSFDGQTFNPRPEMRGSVAKLAERRATLDSRGRVNLDSTYRGGRYLLIAADLVLVGPVERGVGKYSVITGTPMVAGNEMTYSPRLGLEGEVVRRRLRLRAGTYWEPSRYAGQGGRMHGTFGLLVRMFDFPIPFIGRYGLCFSAAVDLAPRYSNVTFSALTFWY